MDFLEKSTMNLKEGFRYQNFLNTLMERQKPTDYQQSQMDC